MVNFYIWIATQIITESFPISSSTHVKIIESFLDTSFLVTLPRYFEDLLHFPTLCVIAIMFFDRYWIMLSSFRRLFPTIISLMLKTALAVVATLFFYVVLEVIGKEWFPIQVGIMITIGALFSLRYIQNSTDNTYTFLKALLLGVAQGIALLPGISRLGITYVAARWLGLSSRTSLEVSLSIQVPLICASLVRGFMYTYHSPYMHQVLNVHVLLVMLVSSIVAYGALAYTMSLAATQRVWFFAIYLIIPLLFFMIR